MKLNTANKKNLGQILFIITSLLFQIFRVFFSHIRHFTCQLQVGKSTGIGGLFIVQGVVDLAGFVGFIAPHHFQAVFVVLHPHQGAAALANRAHFVAQEILMLNYYLNFNKANKLNKLITAHLSLIDIC